MYTGSRLATLRNKLEGYESHIKKIKDLSERAYSVRIDIGDVEKILRGLNGRSFSYQEKPIACIEKFREALIEANEALKEAEKLVESKVACEFLEKDQLLPLCGEPLEAWLVSSDEPTRLLALEAQRLASLPKPPLKSPDDEESPF